MFTVYETPETLGVGGTLWRYYVGLIFIISTFTGCPCCFPQVLISLDVSTIPCFSCFSKAPLLTSLEGFHVSVNPWLTEPTTRHFR